MMNAKLGQWRKSRRIAKLGIVDLSEAAIRKVGSEFGQGVLDRAPCAYRRNRSAHAVGQDDSPRAVPQAVSLSYHDAGRWLDAQETVETSPAPAELVQALLAFAEQHFVPEPKKRQRPQSFQRLTDRFGQPVSISTEGKRKGGPRSGEA